MPVLLPVVIIMNSSHYEPTISRQVLFNSKTTTPSVSLAAHVHSSLKRQIWRGGNVFPACRPAVQHNTSIAHSRYSLQSSSSFCFYKTYFRQCIKQPILSCLKWLTNVNGGNIISVTLFQIKVELILAWSCYTYFGSKKVCICNFASCWDKQRLPHPATSEDVYEL